MINQPKKTKLEKLNIKAVHEDIIDILDGLFLINCENEQDKKILNRIREITQSLDRLFTYLELYH